MRTKQSNLKKISKIITAGMLIGTMAASVIGCTGKTGAKESDAANVQNKTVQNETTQSVASSEGAEVTAASTASERSTAVSSRNIIGPAGLYYYDESKAARVLVNQTYSSAWVKGEDIQCFEVFNSNDATIKGQVFQNIWPKVWFAKDSVQNCRIGYSIRFTLTDGTKVSKMILEPEDTEEYKKYMELYLYDDYHQTHGVWYSHVEQKAYTPENILTSMKLTAGQQVAEIAGDVEVTGFIYSSGNDFDSNRNYIGDNSYTIQVHNTAK